MEQAQVKEEALFRKMAASALRAGGYAEVKRWVEEKERQLEERQRERATLGAVDPGPSTSADGQQKKAELYDLPEHRFATGPIHAKPGDEKVYPWGKLVVQRLPKPVPRVYDNHDCCSGCGYAVPEQPTACRRCPRRFHRECWEGDGAYCPDCLPPGADPKIVHLVHEFEKINYRVVLVERIINPATEARFEAVRQRLAEEHGDANLLRRLHMSSGSFGELCEGGLCVSRAGGGLFGRGLYFSADPGKCDAYWYKAMQGRADGGSVVAAHTGKGAPRPAPPNARCAGARAAADGCARGARGRPAHDARHVLVQGARGPHQELRGEAARPHALRAARRVRLGGGLPQGTLGTGGLRERARAARVHGGLGSTPSHQGSKAFRYC